MTPLRLLMAIGLAVCALAQTRRVFDVVSIKPSPTTNELVYGRTSAGGLYQAEGSTAQSMIQDAFRVRRYQVNGGPDWIDRDRFDISARAETITGPFPLDELWPRLMSLLEDRFAMKARREIREMPIYALVVDKGGAKLKPSEPVTRRYEVARGRISTGKSSLETLAAVLSQYAGRPVVDKTAIPGDFAFTFLWNDPAAATPEELKISVAAGRSLFTALQEDLGLRLEPQRGPVEMIFVDHLEKPSAN